MKIYLPILMSIMAVGPVMSADLVTSIDMEADDMARVKENIGGTKLSVNGVHRNEVMPGAVGDALRFDGYSTYVEGNIPQFEPTGASSFSLWLAPETYPIVMPDAPSTEKITLAGTIDHTSHTGWAFSMDKDGHYSFDCYAGGWLATAEASDIIPCYEWSYIVAVNDPESGTLTLYRNGEITGETKSLGAIGNGTNKIIIGKTSGNEQGAYNVKTFNGLIDEVNVYSGALSGTELSLTPENPADLSIPEVRFAKDLLRPKYHGMPGANWTNETHGMTYSDGLYHVFFQKNANGPYMSRLHWGHLTSENLYDWNEEEIALTPGEEYDHKGCWSGAVFSDEEITGGMPNIIYTGVDYEKARIIQAAPTDASLLDWEKKGIIINGKPSGLSDDFRDPYFFRNGEDAYIIVGTSKDNVGATTLHKYNPTSKTWSNDGSIFFQGTDATLHGTFWEMPNVTPMGNGKWLFTCTPQKTVKDVHVLCWVGEIASDGTFVPDFEEFSNLEFLNQIQGYGLLSPTIYQKDGKTILMGIVPDKLSTSENCNLGWAHLYSLPREISFNEDGELIQKPFEGLNSLRNAEGYEVSDLSLDGVKTIEGIGGRQFEVKGEFTVGDVPFGFNFFKGSKGYASITYNPSNNKLEVNLTKLNRKVNDKNTYNGIYSDVLPQAIEKGSVLKLDVWVDGSIADIFVNDKWASSVRIFPTDSDADGVEVFSNGGAVKVNALNGWLLGDSEYTGNESETPKDDEAGNEGENGVDEILQDFPEYVNVYNVSGIPVKRNVKNVEALNGLPAGIYIIGDKKFLKN